MANDHREVLYTIDTRGNRHWVYTALVRGDFLKKRVIVAWILMAIYLGLPWISISGKQSVHLDIPARRFIFFGSEFWATDTYFLFLIFGMLAFSLFLFTAVLGRVWCGWACPETVFLEFLFRPIERLIEGGPVQRKRLDSMPWNFEKIRKKGFKLVIFSLISWLIASTFLAYFVGREPLLRMMTDWPAANPTPFFTTVSVMSIMMFQFGWFREQFCTVLCPYARFQSVLMDSSSLVVGYDVTRGEPRGKVARKESENLGDCVNCGLCIRVCPTGIDIRNGVQLECLACTACIDACDSVMDQLSRPRGLIRYDTEDRLLGKTSGRTTLRSLARPRPFVYGFLVLGFMVAFAALLLTRQLSEFQIVRRSSLDVPYSTLSDGRINNHLEIQITNKSDVAEHYYLSVEDGNAFTLITPLVPLTVQAHSIERKPIFIHFPESELKNGKRSISVKVMGKNTGFERSQILTLLGPG